MRILEIRDNGGKTFDQYTVIYDLKENRPGCYWSVGMSANPFHPQGFGQHGTAMPGKHLGKKITFKKLPKDCQRLVKSDIQEIAFNIVEVA